MKVNKETVRLGEIKFYLAQAKADFEQQGGIDIWETDFEGKTAEEVAKERTMDSIIWLKILKNKASEMGLKLTTEEREKINIQANQILENIDEEQVQKFGLTNKDLAMMIEESILSERVFREVTKGFTVDEKEFEEFYQNFNQDKEEVKLSEKELEEDKEKLREYYIELRKAEVFQQQYEEWKQRADIEIDEKRWKEISIHDEGEGRK